MIEGMSASRINLGVRGVVLARGRWELAHQKADGDRFTIAVTEAIMWATAVDEMCWKHAPYLAYRADSQGGQYIDELRWARNQGVHRCIAAHSTGLGHGYPVRNPEPDQFEARWLPRSELPPEERVTVRNQKAYDAHVAGEDVRISVYAVETFFTREGFAEATAGWLDY
jgi:hypothetical protein